MMKRENWYWEARRKCRTPLPSVRIKCELCSLQKIAVTSYWKRSDAEIERSRPCLIAVIARGLWRIPARIAFPYATQLTRTSTIAIRDRYPSQLEGGYGARGAIESKTVKEFPENI